MQTAALVLSILVLVLFVALLAVFTVIACRWRTLSGAPKRKKQTPREWWATHKPSKRRLIQVYAALLFNANIKGFVTGTISTDAAKYACVPGLNCYSCPGAVGACPLGALQNALAESHTRAPYYVLGILMLYGVIFARTICGFLCPVGLGQELLYKVKTPKIKKNKATYVLSFFKYVLLAVFVVAIPLLYANNGMALPAFCKYICPAGTFGGALGLLVNPSNADMFSYLGPLFTWKFVVLVAAVAACMFLYRAFCRFLCPLGAIYGFFNRFALLGIKFDRDKCTECGLCVDACKMDIRKVGDHECINCGECIGVCPANAISWKGSKIFVHANVAAEAPSVPPAPQVANTVSVGSEMSPALQTANAVSEGAEGGEGTPETKNEAPMSKKKGRGKKFWLQVAAWGVALAVLAGALLYFNLPSGEGGGPAVRTTYTFEVDSRSGTADFFSFEIGEEGKHGLPAIVSKGGMGTQDDPYLIADAVGRYDGAFRKENGETVPLYFTCTIEKTRDLVLTPITAGDDLAFTVFYTAADGSLMTAYDFGRDGPSFTLSASPEGGSLAYGNKVGDLCYDFTLPLYGEGGTLSLSSLKGKVVVINFWATWCTPCVNELPFFEKIAEEFSDSAVFLAIHSGFVTTDVQGYIDGQTDVYDTSRKWKDWQIKFLQDAGSGYNSEVYQLLGGKNGAYPRTLIVDAEGHVAYIFPGSANETELRAQLSALCKAE